LERIDGVDTVNIEMVIIRISNHASYFCFGQDNRIDRISHWEYWNTGIMEYPVHPV
jgi:hypothetical protein